MIAPPRLRAPKTTAVPGMCPIATASLSRRMSAWNGRRLHFVGIAGAGLSAYALAAKALGADVTGSDRAESPYLARVREAGIDPAIGHDAANLPDGDDVELVVSTAIPRDNPEIAAARERGLTVMNRAEFLAELTREKRTIGVAGAHGKTTTTSMIAHALLGLRAGSGVPHRRHALDDRHERGVGERGVARRRGRRVRPLVPRASTSRSRS